MNLLITYTQCTGTENKMANCVVKDMEPAHWLIAMHEKYPYANTVLISSFGISNEQFIELSELI